MKNLFAFLCSCLFIFGAGTSLSNDAPIQGTIKIECPSMPVRKVSSKLWRCDEEVSVATITINGKNIVIDQFTIPPTYVRWQGGKIYVDACQAMGTAADGTKMILNLPKERIFFQSAKIMIAEAITATGTITFPDGKVGNVVVVYPDCVARRQSSVLRIADAVVATGTVTFP
jgi:hypothetical protein